MTPEDSMERRERWQRAGAALAWGVGLVALARLPAASSLAPGLGVLRGPLGIGLILLASGVALAALIDLRGPRQPPSPVVLFAVTASVYLALGLYYARGLRVSGDEPHYLLMAQSLWREHDLDLQDNFERGDYREYLPALPAPHHGAPRKDGRPYPAHSPGLPALLAPVYAAGGRAACVVVLSLLAAALCLQVRALAEQATGDAGASLRAWAAAAGPPVLFYAFHVYTEVPSALALALALRLLLSAPGGAGAAHAALATAALPWLHVKMIPAAAALGVVALVRLRGRPLAVFVAVAALAAGLYVAYYEWIFGSPTPLALYGGVPQDAAAGSPLRALGGLLLDRSFGLLPTAPLFVLALAALAGLAPRPWRAFWPHLLVGVVVLAPLLGWRMWWGGQCPPARFLVPLVPLLAVAMAQRLAEPTRGMARWRAALLGIGFGLAFFASLQPEAMLLVNRRDRPTRLWDALSPRSGVQVGRYLPSLVSEDTSDGRVALVWSAALALLLVFDQLARRRDGVDRFFRGLGMPLAWLLVVSGFIDYWARAG